jgi:hypothetical protein
VLKTKSSPAAKFVLPTAEQIAQREIDAKAYLAKTRADTASGARIPRYEDQDMNARW